MANNKELLYEAKREWKQLVLETQLRAYREEYGDEELNELMGALKKAGGWLKDKAKDAVTGVADAATGMLGFQTTKQKEEEEKKQEEDAAKEVYRKAHGDLKGFGKQYKGTKGTVKTWGQLKDVLNIANNLHNLDDIKAKANAAGSAARTALPFLLAFIGPAVGPTIYTISNAISALGDSKNVKDLFGTMRKASDSEVEDSPLMDIFKLDDNYQTIVDDKVEKQFLGWFAGWIEKKSNGDPNGKVPDMDINEIFEEFLKDEETGKGVETVTGADSDTKLTQIPYNGEESQVKSAWAKVKAAGEGFIDEIL